MMTGNGWIRTATIAGLAGLVAASFGATADAQERVRWKLASSYPSSLDVLGQNILRLIDNIEIMSDDNFEIQFNEPSALVPALEVFDAVSKARSRRPIQRPVFTPAASRI
jgi:TRAP-type mannitol/chloroaromatic compound transport system substrate-binding protein